MHDTRCLVLSKRNKLKSREHEIAPLYADPILLLSELGLRYRLMFLLYTVDVFIHVTKKLLKNFSEMFDFPYIYFLFRNCCSLIHSLQIIENSLQNVKNPFKNI